MDKFIPEHKYRLKKDFYVGAPPLEYFAKKGEIIIFEGKSLYAHFKSLDGRLILMSNKEAFKYLEEVKDGKKKI